VLLLLWVTEASAGSRISLLPFEGDRPRPVRWRVAYALKRAGHVVLGYAPPTDRSSAASLRSYAEQRDVDLYVSGNSLETPQGWTLSLRFRGPNGKAVGQPLKFQAENLRGLLSELSSEGPTKLERALQGSSPSSVAELPPGRALPLPTRRAAVRKPKSEQPVLPGAAPAEAVSTEERAQAPAKKTAPTEVDLDAAVASAARPETWDADGDEPPAKSASKRHPAKAETASAPRATKKGAAQQLATAGMFSAGASSHKQGGEVDLDAATRSALEEAPKSKARPVLDEPAAETASDPLAEPSAPATAVAAEGESMDADAPDPTTEGDRQPEAKPKKKKGLFAGLSRKSTSSDPNGTTSGASETTLEDHDTSGEPGARHSPGRAVLGASAGYLHRSLEYSDDIYNRLRAPTTNGWVYRFEAALNPFAKPLKDRISLIASYEGGLSGTVQDTRNNRNYGVKFSDLEGGVRFRQPLGEHELGIQATVGQQTAGLDASSAETGIPEISYTLLSPSLDFTLNFGDLGVRTALTYQRCLGFGEISNSEWFPHMEGNGFEGQLGVAYRVSPSVSLHAAGVLRRFVLDMNSSPEDATGGEAEVAGGAVDQYLSGYFGLAFTL
jgi:hypothetical protein